MPPSAAHTGSTARTDVATKPPDREPEHDEREHRRRGARGGSTGPVPVVRSARNTHRSTAYSIPMLTSHGSAISAANRPNDSPDAATASRFVRFDTGSSSDAEFARCVHAYTCGLARTPIR